MPIYWRNCDNWSVYENDYCDNTWIFFSVHSPESSFYNDPNIMYAHAWAILWVWLYIVTWSQVAIFSGIPLSLDSGRSLSPSFDGFFLQLSSKRRLGWSFFKFWRTLSYKFTSYRQLSIAFWKCKGWRSRTQRQRLGLVGSSTKTSQLGYLRWYKFCRSKGQFSW